MGEVLELVKRVCLLCGLPFYVKEGDDSVKCELCKAYYLGVLSAEKASC